MGVPNFLGCQISCDTGRDLGPQFGGSPFSHDTGKATPSQFLVHSSFMKSMRAGGILGRSRHDLHEYGYAASGIQKYYSPNKLDFQKRHAGGGPETKD